MTAFLDVIIWPIYAIGIGAFILALALVAAAVILLIWLAKKKKENGRPAAGRAPAKRVGRFDGRPHAKGE